MTLFAGRLHATETDETSNVRNVDDSKLEENLKRVSGSKQGVEQPASGKGPAAEWVIGDTRFDETPSGKVFFGRLGKLRPGSELGVFDRESHHFTSTPVGMETANYSNFLIDLRSRAIIYEIRPPQISEIQFKTYFKRLYEKRSQDFQSLELTSILSKEDIYKFVAELDVLTYLRANVTPSNPDMGESFARLDEDLERARAKKALIRLENPGGLSKSGDSLVSESIALASAGYGDVELKGRKGEASQSITTEKRVVTEVLEAAKDVPEELVRPLSERLRAVVERVLKK